MMRLFTELIFLIYLLFMANSIGSSDAVRRMSLLSTDFTHNNGNKRSSNETANLEAVNHCKSSKAKGVLHICQYFSNFSRKNTTATIFTSNTSDSEDKRVVPTGSNPLHNR